MTNTEMLRSVVQQRGIKYKYLAAELQLSPYGLMKKVEGETEFKASEIMALSDLLALTEDERSAIFFSRERDE